MHASPSPFLGWYSFVDSFFEHCFQVTSVGMKMPLQVILNQLFSVQILSLPKNSFWKQLFYGAILTFSKAKKLCAQLCTINTLHLKKEISKNIKRTKKQRQEGETCSWAPGIVPMLPYRLHRKKAIPIPSLTFLLLLTTSA